MFTAEARAEAEVTAGDRQALEDPLVALLGAAGELPGEAVGAAARAELETGSARDCLLTGEGLEAAVGAALARRPGRVDRDVAELRAEAMGAAEQLTVDEDAATDADLTEHADKVFELACHSLPVLGERGEVRLVVGADGQARQPCRHLFGDADVRPPEIRRPEQCPGLRLDEARERDGDPGRHQVALCDRVERLPAIRASRSRTGCGCARRLSVWTRRS